MYLKQLLSLAAIAGVSATNSYNLRENNDRALQAAVGCIAGGGDFTGCCPTADPNDGVCSLLWCVNLKDASINDGCGCGQIETACGKIAIFFSMLDGLSDLCAEAGKCCADDGSTANDGFNTCMATAIENGDANAPNFDSVLPGGIPGLEAALGGAGDVPDLGSLIPDGIPDLGDIGGAGDATTTPTVPSSETTVAGATEAPADDTDITGATEPPAATTDGSKSPDEENDANKYVTSTLMSLVGSSLAILFV
eukprot:CAMPEP_0201987128 /NCGR_PEP_ID=MMETSP0904-20121228/91635_1 /ASSEMBLY_ACC=CAM_ASM_000553 /TAXON_ID=420261 /ORGANISM="Thalassiosira antarctica, Strain CCMP982" /LENGTH=251 /DNA_ID=CAMNT_0048541223 /DNA_START=32 /DNA_END=787 /DNA_ORIENTATION=+